MLTLLDGGKNYALMLCKTVITSSKNKNENLIPGYVVINMLG